MVSILAISTRSNEVKYFFGWHFFSNFETCRPENIVRAFFSFSNQLLFAEFGMNRPRISSIEKRFLRQELFDIDVSNKIINEK